MRHGFVRFLLVLISLLSLVVGYISWRIGAGWPPHVAVLVLAFFILMLPLQRMSTQGVAPFKKILRAGTYFSMGMMSFLLAWAVARDVAFIILDFYTPETALHFSEATSGWAFLGIGLLMVLVGAWRGVRGPRVRQVRIPVPDLRADLEGMHIVQISDLHIGPSIGHRYVSDVVAKIQALKPDLTVLTGDIVDGPIDHLKYVAHRLGELTRSGRAFFAPGNHEYYWNFPAWQREFQDMGFRVLLNRGEAVDTKGAKVWVGGVTDRASTDLPDLAKALEGGESADFKLLLSHRPEGVEDAAKLGFHLQLSGHTHRGQFLPWTIFFRFAHKYFIGRMRFDQMWIYVSPGTGSWGPPIRLGSTPEITSLRLERA